MTTCKVTVTGSSPGAGTHFLGTNSRSWELGLPHAPSPGLGCALCALSAGFWGPRTSVPPGGLQTRGRSGVTVLPTVSSPSSPDALPAPVSSDPTHPGKGQPSLSFFPGLSGTPLPVTWPGDLASPLWHPAPPPPGVGRVSVPFTAGPAQGRALLTVALLTRGRWPERLQAAAPRGDV